MTRAPINILKQLGARTKLHLMVLMVYSLYKQPCWNSLSLLTFKKISDRLEIACLPLNTLVLQFCSFLACKYINPIDFDEV